MSKSRKSQRGSAMLMVMLMGIPIFVAVGLVVDVGWAYYTRQAAHAAAESAALAAAQSALDGIKAGGTYTCGSQGLRCYDPSAYTCPTTTPNPVTTTVDAACAYAAANGFKNGGPNGQTVTVVADTTSPPPAVAGVKVNYWVSVRIAQNNPLSFGAVLGGQVLNVGTRSTAAALLTVPKNCVIGLDQTPGDDAVKVQGGADVNVNCGVASNSSLAVDGKVSTLDASSIQAVGTNTGVGTVSPTPVDGAAPAANPYADLPTPTSFTPCTATNESISGATVTLNPGIYCGGISIGGNSPAVTFNPGTYILLGGGLKLTSANTTLTGTGVTFYNTCSSSPCNGGSSGYSPISITGNVTATLSAPTTGPYTGILFYQDPTVVTTAGDKITGGSTMSLTGALYFPESNLEFNGGSSATTGDTIVVAYTVTFSGGSSYLGDNVNNSGSASAPKAMLLE